MVFHHMNDRGVSVGQVGHRSLPRTGKFKEWRSASRFVPPLAECTSKRVPVILSPHARPTVGCPQRRRGRDSVPQLPVTIDYMRIARCVPNLLQQKHQGRHANPRHFPWKNASCGIDTILARSRFIGRCRIWPIHLVDSFDRFP